LKRKDGNYIQLSRKLFSDERFLKLSRNARWLYVVLNELEHRYTGENVDFFFRSNEDLAKDASMSLATLKRAKAELKGKGIVQIWNMHWRDPKTGKLSEKHVTAYRILE